MHKYKSVGGILSIKFAYLKNYDEFCIKTLHVMLVTLRFINCGLLKTLICTLFVFINWITIMFKDLNLWSSF